MGFQEIFALGLGGAALSILYVFEFSYILLVLGFLFWINAIFELQITKPTKKLKIEENTNINTEKVLQDEVPEVKKPSVSSKITTGDKVYSDYKETAIECQYGQNIENIRRSSEIPDVMSLKKNERVENQGGSINTYCSEVTFELDESKVERDQQINRQTIKDEESTLNNTDGKIIIGDQHESSPVQNAESVEVESEHPELINYKKNERHDDQGGTENDNYSQASLEWAGCKNESDQQIHLQPNIKDDESISNAMDTKIIKEEEKKILEDFKNAELHRNELTSQDISIVDRNFLIRVGLDRFYPNKLSLMDAMSIRATPTSFDLNDVALQFVKNIVMMNCNCRDQMLYDFFETIKDYNREASENTNKSDSFSFENIFDDTENENETEVNPLDLLIALFKCSTPMLQQVIANKLFTCKLAIPFILPNFCNKPLEMIVWPLRSIILESKVQIGTFQDMSVDCPCTIVSFIRIGCPLVSKSKLLNEILTDQYHNTFSNKDCPLGTAKRIICDGMVEAAWYIPSNKSTFIRKMTMFLNLRGNAISHTQQLCGMSQITDIIVVMVLLSDLDDQKFKDILYNMFTAKKGVIVAIEALQNNKTELKQKLQNFKKTIDHFQPHESMFNVCVLSVGGNTKNTSIIKKEMRKAIAGMMKENMEKSLYCRLPKCDILTDEEAIVYKSAKLKALKIVKHIPDICLNLKEKVVPLQGETWKSWTLKLKDVNKSSLFKNLLEQGKIKKAMDEDRKLQLEICKTLGPLMMTFLDLLSNSIQSDVDCKVFVLWLKHFLDKRSRSVLPGHLSQYQADWQALKKCRDKKEDIAVIKKCRDALKQSEFNLAEASFGFEHLCREMGQIYESINHCNPDFIYLKKLETTLPTIAAKLLVMGYPFEIMDGDVANVPVFWVKAVLKELKEILGEKKLLALSVLGIQSSGKSTLLNTMFGLQFAVSAGRCTRGVFIQLVPVDIDNSKFNYVLVIDTEGLRAPELASQKHSHDNELATFVIGLGDITIVNIKGENTAEMKDVLQIAVHAFLRLKLANENLNLKQTCVFVHQNVPASDANDKMMQGRQKFVEVLDEMTREAAEQENLADIQSFNQVIDFDSEKNVWYFSDLWHGDPPMAPANPGYSESVRKVKEAIMFRLTNGRDTYLTITDTISRIEDLWNGILKDDFVFSFRNSLELKAYNSMDQHCQTITWKLEKFVLEFIKSEAKSKLVSCGNEEDLENAVPSILIQLTREVDKQVENLNSEMDSFVEKSTLKDILVQWTQAKRNRLCILAEGLIIKAKTAVNNTKEELRIQKLRVTEKTKHEMEINNKAKELALQMKGQVPGDDVLKKKFNSLWNTWINKFTTKDTRDIIPIKDQIESMPYQLFPSDARFREKGRRLQDANAYKNLNHLEGSLTPDNISSNRHLSIHKMYIFLNEQKPDTCKHQAIDLVNRIFRKIDLKLGELNMDGIRFDPAYVTEILVMVSQECKDFNEHKNNDYKFNLLIPFRAMIVNHVVRYAIVFFEKLHEAYNRKNSPKAQMEQYKGTAWELFKNTVENRSEDFIAFGFFRDGIVKVVVDQVSECLPIDAQESIRTLHANGKYSLIKDILIHLAEHDDFGEYKSYIQDPYTYAENWILELLKKKLFGEQVGIRDKCLYSHLAHNRVSKIFLHISKCIADAQNDCHDDTSGCISKWTNAFIKHNCKSPDLPLSTDALVHVRDSKISNLKTFVVMLNEQLFEIEDKVLNSFSNVKSDTVHWKKNPVPDIMDSLWGCSENCMFCHEPCMNTNKDHLEDKFPHKCLQHRPDGIGGYRWSYSNKLAVDFCNYSITTDYTYTTGGGNTGKYKDYKENYPNWDIPPNSDVSKYWMWVMCRYKDQLKEMYGTDDPDIPENWWLIQKDEAMQSL